MRKEPSRCRYHRHDGAAWLWPLALALAFAEPRKDSEDKWWLYQVDEPAEHGEHFLDILEPTIGAACLGLFWLSMAKDIIRKRIDNAPKTQRVTFQMKKGLGLRQERREALGTSVDLPKNALKRHGQIYAGQLHRKADLLRDGPYQGKGPKGD